MERKLIVPRGNGKKELIRKIEKSNFTLIGISIERLISWIELLDSDGINSKKIVQGELIELVEEKVNEMIKEKNNND